MKIFLGLILILSLSLVHCTKKQKSSEKTVEASWTSQFTPIQKLGYHLYFDTRLSNDNSLSCNSCHDVTNRKGGTDGLPTSTGIQGQKGERNAPTVWNATFLSVQFWDGRAKDLAEQAKGPITNPIEMGMPNHQAAVDKIQKIPGYIELFKKSFPKDSNPVNIENLAQAIAAFEKQLVTLNSPFDKYKAGDSSAMTPEAMEGWKTFQNVGCVSCHSGDHFAGPALPLGTGFYQKFPVFLDNEYTRKFKLMDDLGRFEVTQSDGDKHFFRVPTLRNVALTAPYFHNGSVEDLETAVKVMAKTQLNRDLKEDEIQKITAFLKSLTGDLPLIDAPQHF